MDQKRLIIFSIIGTGISSVTTKLGQEFSDRDELNGN